MSLLGQVMKGEGLFCSALAIKMPGLALQGHEAVTCCWAVPPQQQ